MAIIREARVIDVSFQLTVPECPLTDEQLEQHVQGVGNVLFALLGAGMSNAPLPFQSATYVVAKVKKAIVPGGN